MCAIQNGTVQKEMMNSVKEIVHALRCFPVQDPASAFIQAMFVMVMKTVRSETMNNYVNFMTLHVLPTTLV